MRQVVVYTYALFPFTQRRARLNSEVTKRWLYCDTRRVFLPCACLCDCDYRSPHVVRADCKIVGVLTTLDGAWRSRE